MEANLKHDERERDALGRICGSVTSNKIYRTLTTIGTSESTATYWAKDLLWKVASAAMTLKVYRALLSINANMMSQCGLELRCRGLPARKTRIAIAPDLV